MTRTLFGDLVKQAGFDLGDIVRLNHFTTDVDAYLAEGWGPVCERLTAKGAKTCGTLVGVTRLAFPELLIEIEATVVG